MRQSTDLTARVGDVVLPNPIMTASGTSGHGDELAATSPLSELGAVVVKSLAAYPWAGNPPPRLHPVTAGMLNSVGLQGPGIEAWLADDLPRLERHGRAGRREHLGAVGRRLRACGGDARGGASLGRRGRGEPELPEPRRRIAPVRALTGRRRPKRSPRRCAAAGRCGPSSARTPTSWSPSRRAASEAGAAAVTLVNTVMGMVIDLERRRPALGGGGGGLSGRAIHPVAVRAVYDVHARAPDSADRRRRRSGDAAPTRSS